MFRVSPQRSCRAFDFKFGGTGAVITSNKEPGIVERDSCPTDAAVTSGEDKSNPGSGTKAFRIALLTPYSGNNFGDAAILDSMIDHLRARIPGVHFSGISLSCENFIDRHGDLAFPLCGLSRQFHGMAVRRAPDDTAPGRIAASEQRRAFRSIKEILKQVPGLAGALKSIRRLAGNIWSELLHSVRGYRFLRLHDRLIIAGGGQLDEEWGGPWGHPFALFKWSVLARIAHVPCEFVSVGASKVDSRIARVFLSMALRMSQSRSYRDQHSKEIAAGLFGGAIADSVVPDVAFSANEVDLPSSSAIRSAANGRTIIAVSPICYARPGSWPHEDAKSYQHYLHQMSQVISKLLERNYFVVMVRSALSDAIVIKEISDDLDEGSQAAPHNRIYVPPINNWRDLLSILRDVDIVIASRLHSAILSFVVNKPTIAVSFDAKVDRIMEDLGQTDYLLQIGDFSAEDVIDTLCRIEAKRSAAAEEIASYARRARFALEPQFDLIARRTQEV
jgi:polysaccharide pyruvyl transferase WcaK-like protein